MLNETADPVPSRRGRSDGDIQLIEMRRDERLWPNQCTIPYRRFQNNTVSTAASASKNETLNPGYKGMRIDFWLAWFNLIKLSVDISKNIYIKNSLFIL